MRPYIEIEQEIHASRDLIWQTCASADGITRWQADEAEGDARVGGTLTLRWTAFGASVRLNVVDVIPHERIVMESGDTRVEFHMTRTGVRLLHEGVGDKEEFEGLRSSWLIALAQLAHSVERHPGRERRVAWLVQEAQASSESAYLYFTEASCLKLWLCLDGEIPGTGENYRLTLKNRTVLHGKVLANVPGRDLALSVESHGQATLIMRTLPLPGDEGRLVSLVWSEWGLPTSRSQALVNELSHSLETLPHYLARGGAA